MDLTSRSAGQPLQRTPPLGRMREAPSLARSALWLMAAKTAAFALSLAVPLLVVRQLTVRDFGVYKQLFLIVDTAIVLLPLGFVMNAFYFFPREPARKAQVVGNILFFYLLVGSLGGIFVALSPRLVAAVLNSPDLPAYAPAIGVAVLLLVSSSFVECVVIANGEVRLAALIITATQLLRSALLVVAAGVFGSVHALVYAGAVYGVLQGAMMIWYMRSRFSAGSSFEWRLMRKQLSYAMPLAYAGLLWWLQVSMHHYFVSNRYGPEVYAIYAVGCFQLPIMGIVLESVGRVVMPRVSHLRNRNQLGEIIRLAARTVRTIAAVALPVYALMLVTGPEVITVLFTDQYRASWPVFAVNLTLIPLGIISPACDAVFRACPDQLPFLLKARTALLVPLLGGLWIATWRLGLVGPIAVIIGVTLVERLLVARKVARILRMTASDRGLFGDVGKLGVAAAVAGLTTGFVRRALMTAPVGQTPFAVMTICTGAFAVVYLAAALLSRVLTSAEQTAIRQWLIRVREVILREYPADKNVRQVSS